MTIYPVSELPLVPSSKIVRKIQTYQKIQYEIWNYDSNFFCFDENETIKNCRSVIFSYPQNNLLSISPGKSIDNNTFCKKYNCSENIFINEYIDGTMIHLFYDNRRKSWEIASKNNIGCLQKLRRNDKKTTKSLLEMFKDGLGEDINKELNNITLFKYFPKNYCYQFVLLHPENTILYPIKHPLLYMVAVYDITCDIHRAIHIPSMIFETWDFLQHSTILFPKTKKIENWEEISKHQLSIFENNENVCGYLATHIESGERTKFMNPQYVQAKEMNRVNPRLGLYYLCLRKRNLVQDYLTHFPQFRNTFRKFCNYFNDYIEELHTAYLVKFVWKNIGRDKIHEKYRNYIDDIHRDIYLKSQHNKRKIVTRQVVYEYMLNKPPGEIIYILSSCRRKSLL